MCSWYSSTVKFMIFRILISCSSVFNYLSTFLLDISHLYLQLYIKTRHFIDWKRTQLRKYVHFSLNMLPIPNRPLNIDVLNSQYYAYPCFSSKNVVIKPIINNSLRLKLTLCHQEIRSSLPNQWYNFDTEQKKFDKNLYCAMNVLKMLNINFFLHTDLN